MAQARLSTFFRSSKGISLPSPPQLPERWKGGRIEKFGQYWKNVLRDYKEAVLEVKQGARKRPLRATLLTTAGLSCLYLNRHNPDERTFREQFLRHNHDLMMVPGSIRNLVSETQQDVVSRSFNLGLIRRWNLGLCSIMWRDNFAEECGLASSQCEYLKPGYLDFVDRVVDVGFLDRWWIMDKKMKDFDVNEEEWDERGMPRNPSKQLS